MKMKMKMNMKMKMEPLFYHSFLTCSCFLFAFLNFLGFSSFFLPGAHEAPDCFARERAGERAHAKKSRKPWAPHETPWAPK